MIFEINIFSPRWGHDDTYIISVDANQLRITATGSRNAVCIYTYNNVSGNTFTWDSNYESLIRIFRNDSIVAPENILETIEYNWSSLINKRITEQEFQDNFNLLATWISNISKTKPNFKE